MSDTIIDFPKVTQMLDAGWRVRVYKGPMGSYEVRARHKNPRMIPQALAQIAKQLAAIPDTPPYDPDGDVDDGWLMTDDFTPEQALTRMAYKVHGLLL